MFDQHCITVRDSDEQQILPGQLTHDYWKRIKLKKILLFGVRYKQRIISSGLFGLFLRNMHQLTSNQEQLIIESQSDLNSLYSTLRKVLLLSLFPMNEGFSL